MVTEVGHILLIVLAYVHTTGTERLIAGKMCECGWSIEERN